MGSGGTADGFWSANMFGPEGSFPGKQVYVVAFNAPTIAAATQEGIFTYNGAQWTFPHSTSIPNAINPDLEDLVSNPFGPGATLRPGAQIIYGSGLTYDPFNEYAGGATLFQLQVIPEPSALTLAALGFLSSIGFLMKRRSK